MGGNYYLRTIGDSLFEIPKPISSVGIGIDQLPEFVKRVPEITPAELARLGSLEYLPEEEDLKEVNLSRSVLNGLNQKGLNPICYAKDLIANNHVWDSMVFLMITMGNK